ncbi:hypothetical protein [Brevibacterium sp. CFH 10365]|uniref:hypothetical protein n=1 Tax=Brevibacterium sp. CFH 10365 TaxID=2585207 RepID=UPI0012664BF6|nr:hypothetical protein [Brevibacterium sp. CFH 10365]
MSHTPGPRHPGWLARSLFWAALIVGVLPALVLAPMSFTGGQDTLVLFSVGTIVAGCLRLVLGTIAILLVKNTTWVRRSVGAAIFVLGCLALLVLGPLMSVIVGMSGTGPADSMLTMTVIQGVVSGVYLSAVFCGWNIARNRRWWILVIAVAIAVVLNVVNSLFDQMLAAQLAGGVMVTVVVQAVWLAVTFGVLGLCHLLGRVRGRTAPPPSRPAPVPQQGYAPQPYPQSGQTVQPDPNQRRPGPEQWSNPHH